MTEDRQHTRNLNLGTPARLRAFVLLAITIAGLYLCYLLMVPFLPALTWALALAILFMPVHRWFEAKLNNANLAAAISTLLIGVIVVAPVTLLAGRVVTEAASGAVTFKDKVASGEWRRTLEANDTLAPVVAWVDEVDLPAAIENAASWLTATSASFVSGSAAGLISLVLTFYLLFYFLRDRAIALGWIRKISPLSTAEMNRLFKRIVDTIHATIYGTVVVAAVQGALGGLMFWWLGLPMPLLWGLVMALMAVIPVLGAFVIWIPAALYLALEGSWDKALMLAVWGAVVVGGIDNLLYPMLVGQRLRLHTIPAFMAIVGGLYLFGASGLVLGPLIVTVTMFFVEIWRVPVRGAE